MRAWLPFALATGGAAVALCCARPGSGPPAGAATKPGVVRVEVPPDAPEPPPSRVVAQIGHNLDVWALAWSPSGTRIATGGFEHTIRIWNDKGRLLATLAGHREALTELGFDSHGEVLASAARDGTVRLWDLHHAGKHRVLEKAGDHLAFEPGGKRVASVGYDLGVRVWDVKHAKLERTLTAPRGRQLRAVAWSADGARIAAATLDGQLYFWDPQNETPLGVASGCGGAMASVAFAPDGRTVACAGRGLELVDVATHATRTLSAPDTDPYDVAFSPDGKTVATNGTTNKVHLWDVASGKHLTTIPHQGYVSALAFSPDGRSLAVGGKVPTRSTDGSLLELPVARVWDLSSAKQVMHFEGLARPVSQAAWNANGSLLLTASTEVATWDAQTGARQRLLDPSAPVAALFAPQGSLVAIATRNGVRILDAESGKEIGSVRGRELYPVWSPDGRSVAVHSLESVQLFDVEKKRALRLPTPGKASLARDVAFTPDSRSLAVATSKNIELYAVTSGKLEKSLSLMSHVHAWENAETLGFSPTGELAATLNGKGMTLWDANGAYQGLLADRTRFAPPAWSPDGKRLAYSAENDVKIQGETSGYAGHEGVIRSIAFARDGQRFASSSDDSTVRVWQVGQKKPLRVFDTHEGRVWSVAWHPSADVLLAGGNEAQMHRVKDGRTLRVLVLPGATGAAFYTDDGTWCGDPNAAKALLMRSTDDLLDPSLDGDGGALHEKPELLADFVSDTP